MLFQRAFFAIFFINKSHSSLSWVIFLLALPSLFPSWGTLGTRPQRACDGELFLRDSGFSQRRHLAKCSGYLQCQELSLVTISLLLFKGVIWHPVAWKSQQFGAWQTESNLENPGAQASTASSLVTRRDCCGEFMQQAVS